MGVKVENGLNGMIMDRRRKKEFSRKDHQRMVSGFFGIKMDRSYKN